jgi:hypothetical protein
MKTKDNPPKETGNSAEDEMKNATKKLKKKELQIKILKIIINNNRFSDNKSV